MKSVLRLVGHGDVGVGKKEFANVRKAKLEALKTLKGKAAAEQGFLVVFVILANVMKVEERDEKKRRKKKKEKKNV